MKRYLFFVLAVLLVCLSSLADGRTGKMLIAAQECEYDTLVHRRIGPGATYTQFQFNDLSYDGNNYKMRAHVIEVDLNNQYNVLEPYLAKNKFLSVDTQIQQYNLDRKNGKKPLASINSLNDWFHSNQQTDKRKSYEMQDSYVRNGKILYQRAGKHLEFYIDNKKNYYVENLQLSGIITAGGQKLIIGNINHSRDFYDASGYVALFCNGYSRSFAADNSEGIEVVIKKKDGTDFSIGNNECTVLRVIEGSNNTIGEGEAILSAAGDNATKLSNLKEGDEISISMNYLNDNGDTVDVCHLMSTHFGWSVKDGEVVLRGRKNCARPSIGYSQDGKTLFLSDIEISQYSNAPEDCMSYLLKNLGAWNVCWSDGGPSAEMQIDGEFVTINSIGYGFNGRYIPGGIMLYSTAPDDSIFTDIELSDPTARRIYVGQTLDIPTYAYNQYGEMIQKDAEKTDKIELSCTNNLGTFSNGVFTATKAGEGVITLKVAGTDITKSIPITVSEHRVLTANPENLFTGEGRECQLTLTLTDSEGTHEIKPEDAVWTTNSKYVITGCTNGRIVPMVDGKADVYVTYDGLCDTVNVTVENLETEVDYLDLTDNVEDKKSPDIQLPSVPHSFTASIKGEPGSIVSLYYTLGSGYVCTQPDTIAEDSTVSIHVPLDYDGLTTYPVNIVNLTSSSKTDAPVLTGLIAYYTADVDGINEIATDLPSSSRSQSIYSLTGQRLSHIQRGINIVNRRKVVAEIR